MNNRQIVYLTSDYVKTKLQGETTGHDWWHTVNVQRAAAYIGRKEGANLFIVELGALLHDIADWKFHGGDRTANSRAIQEYLTTIGVDETTIARVCEAVKHVSLKGIANQPDMSLEAKVVQDADSLEAIGAIAVARTFIWGGYKKKPIYDPSIPMGRKVEAYAESPTSIHYFYERLVHLKDRLHTATARKIAEKRHRFMQQFLQQFFTEWQGKDLR